MVKTEFGIIEDINEIEEYVLYEPENITAYILMTMFIKMIGGIN